MPDPVERMSIEVARGRDEPGLDPRDAAARAAAWLDHDRTGRETRFWAWERVDDVIGRQPVTGWLLVRHLIAGAADEAQLGSVAAPARGNALRPQRRAHRSRGDGSPDGPSNDASARRRLEERDRRRGLGADPAVARP
jgi:hypothetical protein